MAWISVHNGIDGPKLRELRKMLKCSKYEATGILVHFWFWGLENAQKDGLILNADKEDLYECFAGISSGTKVHMREVIQVLVAHSIVGEDKSETIIKALKSSGVILTPDMVVNSLIETGWIDETDNGFVIHDWEIWQEQWYKAKERRESDVKRKRAARNLVGKASEDSIQESDGKPKEEKSQASKAKESQYSVRFEEFWTLYPRKVGKGEAYKQYLARRKDGFSDDELIEAAKNYAAQCEKLKTDKQYIKHAKTFLSANTPFVDYIKPVTNASSSHKTDDKSYNPYSEWGS